ncbi:MAG: hypothetical protein C4575_13025 [Desulforudis sp.]|jgi:hypothetical protein|nr:MAG: hypothetical protein C4575_13025 [Desulforudis sp.]
MNEQCQEQALFRYTWPGQDEKFICLTHAVSLRNIANAMGLFLQLIPLSDAEQQIAHCSQIVSESDQVKG